MIDFNSDFYLQNNYNLPNVLNKIPNISWNNSNSYNENNLICNFNPMSSEAHINKSINWLNENMIFFTKSDSDSRFLAIPIHHFTRGKVFRPIRSSNIFENSIIDYLNNQIRNYHIKSLSNISMSNNFIHRNNLNLITENDNLEYFDGVNASYNYLPQTRIEYINMDSETESVSEYNELDDDEPNTNISELYTSGDDVYTFNIHSHNSKIAKTPSDSNEIGSSKSSIGNQIVKDSTFKYMPIKNDPLDYAFSEWYNANNIQSNWKRIRKGLYNVEGKLTNISLVDGKLFVRIVDNFTKKPFNMPIGVYVVKCKDNKFDLY